MSSAWFLAQPLTRPFLHSATQRRGRAGRVREGSCYRLYSKQRLASFPSRELPELLRTPLEQVCLQIKLMKLGRIAQVFSEAIEPPQSAAVVSSVEVRAPCSNTPPSHLLFS